MPSSEHSLGPYLRAIREEQGIDLKDVAASTKIQPKFIEALESENYNQLPRGPFIIGFLRSYAQCLSLDADEVIAFFQASQGRRTSRPPVALRQRPAAEPSPSWRRPVLLGVGGMVLLAISFFALRGGSEPEPAAPSATIATETPADRQVDSAPAVAPPAPQEARVSETPSPASPASKPVEAPPAAASSQAETASAETPAPLSPRPLILRVDAQEETWLRVEIDEGNRRETLMQAGQSVEWKANSQFSLTLGNVQGVRVALNDQKLDLPKTRSNVLRDYVLTRALLTPRRTD